MTTLYAHVDASGTAISTTAVCADCLTPATATAARAAALQESGPTFPPSERYTGTDLHDVSENDALDCQFH